MNAISGLSSNTVTFNKFRDLAQKSNQERDQSGSVTEIVNEASRIANQTGTSGFFKSIVEKVKNFGKNLRNNPWLSWIFDYFQHGGESSKALAKAKNRNYVKNGNDLIQYHDSLVFKQSNPNGIYKSHFAPPGKAKTQVYLFLGHCQGFKDKEEETGILKIYNKLVKDNDCDVVLFRVGCAMTDLKHVSGLSKQTDLKPEVVKEHIANIIEDRNHSRGIFSGLPKPANVVIAGYSWGAGLSKEILDRWKKIGNDTEVSTSMTLDAVKYGVDNFADSLQHRPPHSNKHLNIFQPNDLILRGDHLYGIDHRRGDVSIDVNQINPDAQLQHTEVDNDPNVINLIYKNIRQSVINSPASKPGKLILQKV
jgi:hypothetical protein